MSIKLSLVALLSIVVLGATAREREGGGDKESAAYKAAREAAEARVSDPADRNRNMTQEERQKLQAQRKEDLAEYKDMVKANLATVKAMFQAAEQAWKAQNYKIAGINYQSVSKATVPGSEEMVEVSVQRINADMEKLARQRIAAADDAGLKRDFMKQIAELTVVLNDFSITAAAKDASNKLNNVRSKPEVAGIIEYATADQLIKEGSLTDGIARLTAIVNNPRYENSIAALKAQILLDNLGKNEETRGTIKKEFQAKADKEAPALLNLAKNFATNNQPKAAKEKLETVIEKFPDTTYAEEAKKRLEVLASGK